MARTNLPEQGARQDMFLVTLEVASNNLGYWDKKTGGELDSEEVKYYPGGIYKPVSLGGRQSPGNITLQRLFDRIDDWEDDDTNATIRRLIAGVGKHDAKVVQRPLDQNADPFGTKRVVWTGKLKRVLIPDIDSESTAAALVEVEISVQDMHFLKADGPANPSNTLA